MTGILLELRQGDRNFYQLKKIIGHPTATLERLRELERTGLVSRGPRGKRGSMAYSLTERGREISNFVNKHRDL
ncbi:MAG: winged helix-turn-helix transcriptional regulator [Halobacteria archaeon]